MRHWLSVAALLILSLVVYWPTVTHEYGFRDDYSNLREVRERPGWLMTLTSSSGRPVYGALLEGSLTEIHQVAELAKLRALAAVLAGVVGVLLWWQLRRSGWSDMQAAAMGAAVMVLPGIQVVVGWAIAWPIALALIVALVGFQLVERGMHTMGRSGARVRRRRHRALLHCGSHLSNERAVRHRAVRGRAAAAPGNERA
jgi:hypothetical protein